MLANEIPAKTNNVDYWHMASAKPTLFVWAKWSNHEDSKLMFYCDEQDFRRLAITYLWAWFVQDIVRATWWRIFRRGRWMRKVVIAILIFCIRKQMKRYEAGHPKRERLYKLRRKLEGRQ